MSHLIRLTHSETRDLTPDLANEFAEMPASVTERDLDPKRIARLREKVLSGLAISFNWARGKVLATGEIYRVNGHHSSLMLSKLNGNFPAGLQAHVDDYEVDDANGLALLFRQFDDRKSARTLADISGVYQMIHDDLRQTPKEAARKAIEGAAWYEGRIVGIAMPKGDDVFTLFNQPKYHDFVKMVGSVYSSKTPEFSQPVIGAMYGTYDRNPQDAETFWLDVARQGGGNEEKHPTTVLDAWLLAGKQSDNPPGQMEVYRACVLAWNAYRNRRNLDRIGKFDPKKGWPDLE